jgi:hypothetical protein
VKLTKAQKQALVDVAADPICRARGQERRTVYALVALGLVEVLKEKDAGGFYWWHGWKLTELGEAVVKGAKS